MVTTKAKRERCINAFFRFIFIAKLPQPQVKWLTEISTPSLNPLVVFLALPVCPKSPHTMALVAKNRI
jgi:hypothetical protein